MKQKIKDITDCNRILDANTSLQMWFNDVISKYEEELTVFDVLRCIRQNLFIEIAFNKMISILKAEPFCGEMYDGEMLEYLYNLLCDNKSKFVNFYPDIRMITKISLKLLDNYEWESEKEKERTISVIGSIQRIIEK